MVRRDLSRSQQAVQAAHAILEASRQGLISPDDPHPHLVLCGNPDEASLLDQAERLTQAQIKFAVFREADLDDQATAIATEPLNQAQRRLFRDLKLLQL